MYVRYQHHDKKVVVKKEDKGLHKQHCLCHAPCNFFRPQPGRTNCIIAEKLFKINKEYNLVTPVWECRLFEPMESGVLIEED